MPKILRTSITLIFWQMPWVVPDPGSNHPFTCKNCCDRRIDEVALKGTPPRINKKTLEIAAENLLIQMPRLSINLELVSFQLKNPFSFMAQLFLNEIQMAKRNKVLAFD